MTQNAAETRPCEPTQPTPAVSVVVPCYNGGRFIDQLLASLGRQTFRNFEIVIVDDGSTERATLDKLDSLDPAIRVVHQENRGLSGARNSGVAAAKSDIVLLIDCDDEIEPTYLAETVPALRNAPPDVAIAFAHTRLAGSASGLSRRYFNRFALLFANTLPSTVVMRKSCCQAVGGYDESMRDGYEDWEFYIRLSRAGYRSIEIPKPLGIYNISPDGMLLGKATRLHGKLWRYIRTKHADAYRLPSILRLWWATRHQDGHVTLIKALAAYTLAVVLPDAWFSRLVGGMRNRKLASHVAPEPKAAGGRHAQHLSAPSAG